MRYVVGCLCSAVTASLFTAWLVNPAPSSEAVAQGTNLLPLQVPGAKAVATDTSSLFNEDGLTPEEVINVAVYERLHKSVVNINTESTRTDFLFETQSEGTGSGSVIDKLGHILTNWHVVANARIIRVTLYNGETYEAKVVGFDPPNDIAIIKVDAPEKTLYPITMGDSSKLKVGMRVLAIGNPFELERTLTTGIVSSLNRSLELQDNWSIKSIIQVDAAINPGNSGGPLLDLHGRLIGINTAIASKTGQSSGVGFAIPVNLVSRVVPELVQHGRVFRPEVGIQRVFETEEGLLVEQLTPDGPAKTAGIRGPTLLRQRRGPFVFEKLDRSTADLLVAVNGKDVRTVSEFREAIQSFKPGDTVKLTVIREKRRIEVSVELGGGPPARRTP
ncbi:MAG: trypsin-like peptidase domain-containing protein [Planctomycetota bacterium]|nr:trypsin-like peptidase domain-containing protein [Planctomycetota bacterium]MDA1250443.1 trypsin-like peptidase domain-containing protein [Planctomycetota bacterium]